MDVNEFKSLTDGVYEFVTYMDEKIIGIPVYEPISGIEYYYIIYQSKIIENNFSSSSLQDKLNNGIVYMINPEVIDIYKKIS